MARHLALGDGRLRIAADMRSQRLPVVLHRFRQARRSRLRQKVIAWLGKHCLAYLNVRDPGGEGRQT